MGFLKFLFFTVVGIWFVGLILRATVNRWLKKRAEEYNRAAAQARREANRQARGRKEGDMVIETRQTTDRKVRRDVGDYVEFEEITETTSRSTSVKNEQTQ